MKYLQARSRANPGRVSAEIGMTNSDSVAPTEGAKERTLDATREAFPEIVLAEIQSS